MRLQLSVSGLHLILLQASGALQAGHPSGSHGGAGPLPRMGGASIPPLLVQQSGALLAQEHAPRFGTLPAPERGDSSSILAAPDAGPQ